MDSPRRNYVLRIDRERVKYYMKEQGLTDATVAAKAGVHPSAVSDWKVREWPLFSAAATAMQVNPLVLVEARRVEGGWSVLPNKDRFLRSMNETGCSVRVLARKLRVNRNTILHLYKNENTFIPVRALADALGVPPLSILRVDDQ